MIYLLLANAGVGKSHWIKSSHTKYIDCTTSPHRSVLVWMCNQLHIEVNSRSNIDDLLRLLLLAPSSTFALDNIDRTSPKLLYSLLSLSQHHIIYCTATSNTKIQVLIDRQSAILVPVPSANILQMLKEKYPSLSAQEIHKINSIASTPASASNIANAIIAGESKNLPIPPSKSIMPVVAIVAITILLFVRYNYTMTPIMYALIGACGYYARRLLWKSSQ
jgi:hypothetical protein